MPFFNPTNEPGHFTTKNEIYRQRARPVEETATQPVGKGAQPPPETPAGGKPLPGAKLAPPDLETTLKGMTPAENLHRVGDFHMEVNPAGHGYVVMRGNQVISPPKNWGETAQAFHKAATAAGHPNFDWYSGPKPAAAAAATALPPKAAKAVAQSKAAAAKGAGEVVVGQNQYGAVRTAKYTHKMTLREALEKHGTAPGLMDKLTAPFRDMMIKSIGNMPVHFMDNAEFRKLGKNNYVGMYFWQQNHIAINNKYAGGKEFAKTILHEGVHGITSHALGTVPEVRAAVKQIMFDVRSKTKPEGPTKYGFTNEREFIAEAFSNPKFQQMLADHILSPKVAAKLEAQFKSPIKSAWDALVQTVRKTLGMKPSETSALEAVMKATERAMAENPAAKEKYMASEGVGKPKEYGYDATPSQTDAMAAPGGRETVTARDKFGNEAKFTGDTVHAAAAYAKGAGYKPNQIFHQDGTLYKPPAAAAAQLRLHLQPPSHPLVAAVPASWWR